MGVLDKIARLREKRTILYARAYEAEERGEDTTSLDWDIAGVLAQLYVLEKEQRRKRMAPTTLSRVQQLRFELERLEEMADEDRDNGGTGDQYNDRIGTLYAEIHELELLLTGGGERG